MTEKIKDGGPAFARHYSEGYDSSGNLMFYPPQEGMSLRDYFAAKALQGIMADPDADGSWDEIAQRAYKLADAMLKVGVEA